MFKAAGFSVLSVAGALALGAFAPTAAAAANSSALSFNPLNPFAILSQASTLQGPADPTGGATVAANDNDNGNHGQGNGNGNGNGKPKKSKKDDGGDGNNGGGNG
jgi:hypothetical protein